MSISPDPAPWRPLRKATNRDQLSLSTGQDIENALQSAERMFATSQQDRRHYENLRLVAASTFIVVGLSVIGAVISVAQSVLTYDSFIILIFLVPFAGVMLAWQTLRVMRLYRYRSKFSYSGRLAAELASMVEQSYVAVAEREQWSEFRLNSIRLRLSAFPLIPFSAEEGDLKNRAEPRIKIRRSRDTRIRS